MVIYFHRYFLCQVFVVNVPQSFSSLNKILKTFKLLFDNQDIYRHLQGIMVYQEVTEHFKAFKLLFDNQSGFVRIIFRVLWFI